MFDALRGTGDVRMSTGEIMALTRGEPVRASDGSDGHVDRVANAHKRLPWSVGG